MIKKYIYYFTLIFTCRYLSEVIDVLCHLQFHVIESFQKMVCVNVDLFLAWLIFAHLSKNLTWKNDIKMLVLELNANAVTRNRTELQFIYRQFGENIYLSEIAEMSILAKTDFSM